MYLQTANVESWLKSNVTLSLASVYASREVQVSSATSVTLDFPVKYAFL